MSTTENTAVDASRILQDVEQAGTLAYGEALKEAQEKIDEAILKKYDVVDPSEKDDADVDDDADEGDSDEGIKRSRANADAGTATGDKTESPELSLDDLKAKAREVGLTEEEIAAFGDKLNVAMNVLSTTLGSRKTSPATTAKSEVAEEEGESHAKESQEYKVGLSADDYDPGLIKELESLHKHFQAKIDALSDAVNSALQSIQISEALRFEAWADKQFALAVDYEKQLGKGTVDEIDRDSTQFKNRQAVIKEFFELKERRLKNGLPPLSDEALFEQAIIRTFPEDYKHAVRRQIGNSIERRKRVAQTVSSGRRGSGAMGPDAAVKIVENMLAKYRE